MKDTGIAGDVPNILDNEWETLRSDVLNAIENDDWSDVITHRNYIYISSNTPTVVNHFFSISSCAIYIFTAFLS